MTIGSILFATAIFLLVGVIILRPFFVPPRRTAVVTQREQLLNEKAALLAEVQAIEFDFETGKLPEVDYEAERTERVQQAATVLQQLDELPVEKDSVSEQIEAAIAALRGKELVADGWICDSCSSQNSAENKFCGQCGGSAS